MILWCPRRGKPAFGMKRVGALVAVAALIVVAAPSGVYGTEPEPTIERTAPYDFGVLTGRLVGASAPCVTLGYALIPVPMPCQNPQTATTNTGIYVDTTAPVKIRLSAAIRNVGPVDVLEGLEACLSYSPAGSSGFFYGPMSCSPVPSAGGEGLVTTQLEGTVWADGVQPGRHAFSVGLRDRRSWLNAGGPTAVQVEKIFVYLEPVETSATTTVKRGSRR